MEHVTVDELIAASRGMELSHMCIDGDIPPQMDTIAPNLQWLELRYLSHKAELQRFVIWSLDVYSIIDDFWIF
jgi:hypothetical protein